MRRLRWRMRGAWLWPAFLLATVVGGVLLDRLPVAGENTQGPGLAAGLLIAGFLNLIAVILLGGLGGVLLRRRRPDLPRDVARDYAATVAVGLVCVALLGAGLLHRPDVLERKRDLATQMAAARAFIAHRGPADARPNARYADTLRLEDDLFRTCAPRRDPDRAFCVYVDTEQSPPGITVDTSGAPNAKYAPLAPGAYR